MKRIIPSLVFLMSICGSVQAQTIPLKSYLIWSAAQDVAQAVVLASIYRAQKEEVNNGLAAARAAFWELSPNSPGFEAARQAYSIALTKKDLFNSGPAARNLVLTRFLSSGAASSTAVNNVTGMFAALEGLTGGSVETIHPLARVEFTNWIQELLRQDRLGAKPDAAFQAALPLYNKYTDRRDMAEYLFQNPHSPLLSANAHEVGTGVIATCRAISFADAAKRSAELESIVRDNGVFLAAAKAEVDFIKKDMPNLREYTTSEQQWRSLNPNSPPEAICAAPGGLVFELTQRSTRMYVVGLVANRGGTIKDADTVVQGWEKQVGAATVLAAAERVRAGTAKSYGVRVDDRSLCASSQPFTCITEVLGVEAPDIPIRPDMQRWIDEFASARSTMNRPATIALIQKQMMAEGSSAEEAAARYSHLIGWLDESLLLASFAYADTHTVVGPTGNRAPVTLIALRDLTNFSYADGFEKALVAGLILQDEIPKSVGRWPDSIGALEHVEKEYQSLLKANGDARIAQAAATFRRKNLEPSDRGLTYYSNSNTDSLYVLFLRSAGDTARLRARSEAAAPTTIGN